MYKGGGSEGLLLCLNGLERVGGLAGRRVAGAGEGILMEGLRGVLGDVPPMTDAVLSMPESRLLDLRWKRPKDGILWEAGDVGVIGERM